MQEVKDHDNRMFQKISRSQALDSFSGIHRDVTVWGPREQVPFLDRGKKGGKVIGQYSLG